MANFSCDAFSSINEALTQANMGKLNTTTYVAACPQICTIAWGTGNPDLSGIGPNISYILQAVLTFIFGPIFCLAYGSRKRWIVSEKLKDYLEILQDTFLDISAQLSIAVAIAAVIRFHQHAPFYELAFLRSLTTMQFLSFLCSTVTSGVFEKRIGATRKTILIIYGLLEFGLYMGLIVGLWTSQASWQTLSELGQACGAYGHLSHWIPHIPSPIVHFPHITFEQYLFIFVKNGWKFELILTGLVLIGCLALVIVCNILFLLFTALTSKNAVATGIISFGLTIGMLVELTEMEKTRNVMKSIMGSEFQDNQWGLGQIIALFLWAPLCLQTVYTILLRVFDDIEPVKPTTIRGDVETGYGQTPTIKPRPYDDNEKEKSEDNSQTDEKTGINDETQMAEKSQFEKTEIHTTAYQVPH
ncbi:hypothetical protein BDN70DRAFT_932886 [Pholiota conissans]|uniref:Uncharacterized protein n=1 Tax=Pholiota conissans TaxID=109636 RepID=A0A9P5Z0A4_9AGAR|nr:hypothetical protein BDN70DRAFT_932886 [Pholiota conissans]